SSPAGGPWRTAGPQRRQPRLRALQRLSPCGRTCRGGAAGRHHRRRADRRPPGGRGMISLWHYLAVAAVLFALGLVGYLTRRNFITMFLSAELMLQGVVLNLLAFARFHGDLNGQAFALFVITIAACEAAVAMALIIAIYRQHRSLDSS